MHVAAGGLAVTSARLPGMVGVAGVEGIPVMEEDMEVEDMEVEVEATEVEVEDSLQHSEAGVAMVEVAGAVMVEVEEVAVVMEEEEADVEFVLFVIIIIALDK